MHTAELKAILGAVIEGKNCNESNRIIIATDSSSSIQSMNKCQQSNPLASKILEKIKQSNKVFRLCWVPSHCGVRGNEEADRAAVSVAINGIIVSNSIPRTDYRNFISQVVKSAWKVEWENVSNNKLRAIKPNIEPFKTCL